MQGANLRLRYLILTNLWGGRGVSEIVDALQAKNSTIYKYAARHMEAGLIDQRKISGKRKVDAKYLGKTYVGRRTGMIR